MSDQTPLLKATHEGTLNIAGTEISCAVLEDGTRVITNESVFKALGRPPRGSRVPDQTSDETRILPSFLEAKNLQPFVSKDVSKLINKMKYLSILDKPVNGYNARVIPQTCIVYMEASSSGVLKKNQLATADQAKQLLLALAEVGIVGLVDEATGYQANRDRSELETLLARYLNEAHSRWVKMFPDAYYEQIFRLKSWSMDNIRNRPGVIGHYTNDLIYSRLAPGVMDKLQELNPERDHMHHQHFTNDGKQDLQFHINSIVTLMQVSRNWSEFVAMVDRVKPKLNMLDDVNYDLF